MSAVHAPALDNERPAVGPGVWSNNASTVITRANRSPGRSTSEQLPPGAVGFVDRLEEAVARTVRTGSIGVGAGFDENAAPLDLDREERGDVGAGHRDDPQSIRGWRSSAPQMPP